MTERTRDYLEALAGMAALCVLIAFAAVGLPILFGG